MASRTQQPDLTVLEYGRLVDTINAGIDTGDRTFQISKLAEAADLTDAQVYEALSHLSQKHDHISDVGEGTWRVDPVAE